MDSIYEVAVLSTGPAAAQNNAFTVLWNTSATETLTLLELGMVSVSGGTLPKFALTRISARGTQTATSAGEPWDAAEPAAAGTVDSAWSAQPTVTGNYLRRAHMLGQQSSGLFWLWWGQDEGLVVAPSAGIGVVLATAIVGPTQETHYVWAE